MQSKMFFAAFVVFVDPYWLSAYVTGPVATLLNLPPAASQSVVRTINQTLTCAPGCGQRPTFFNGTENEYQALFRAGNIGSRTNFRGDQFFHNDLGDLGQQIWRISVTGTFSKVADVGPPAGSTCVQNSATSFTLTDPAQLGGIWFNPVVNALFVATQYNSRSISVA